MPCGISFGCGSSSYYSSRSSIDSSRPSTCGGFVGGCGYSSRISSRNVEKPNNAPSPSIKKEKSYSTREIFVYDVNKTGTGAFCLIRAIEDGKVTTRKEKLTVERLVELKKDKLYDSCSLIGITFKKDGSFDLKPKALKPFEKMLEQHIVGFDKHYDHMKDMKEKIRLINQVLEDKNSSKDEIEDDLER